MFCGCSYSHIVPADTKAAVLAALKGTDLNVRIVPDLCGTAADEKDSLQKLASGYRLKVIACFPRAVKWLLEWAGVDTCDVVFFDMRSSSPEQIIDSLGAGIRETQPEMRVPDSPRWIPWFPVIDRDRCTHCRQCLNFCLFGVYSLVESDVSVTNPRACKTNCPACAKVCPNAAIIFPKYDTSPINGDIVDENAIQAVNLEALTDGDLQERLRQRTGRKRFAPADTSTAGVTDLKTFQQQLGIPQDVIDSLSPVGCPNADVCDNNRRKDNHEK